MRENNGPERTQGESRSLRSRCRAESGQGLVELGILVPVMVFILVGVVDFGRLFMIRQTITNAAREGARIAILGDSSSTVTQKVQWYLQHAGLDTSKATISVSGTNNTTAQPVNVTVGYAAQSLVLKLVHAKSQISMTSTSAMLHE